MKRVLNAVGGFLSLLVLGALVVVMVLTLKAQRDESGAGTFRSPIRTATSRPVTETVPPSSHVPSPQPPPKLTPVRGQGTPTPAPYEFGTPPAILTPSATPLPISKVTDLVPELPENDKAKVYVQRFDGTYEVFLIRYEMDIAELPLASGDVVVKVVPPASLMGHRPPVPTYPVPATPTDTPFISPLATPTPN